MSSEPQRILIVEDDGALRLTLAASLKAEGYRTVEAFSLHEARERLAARNVDLVILDLGLPDGDGISLLKEVRAAGELTPIIVLTARSDENTKVTALDLGADDYVTKPFGLAELIARVRSAFRHGVQMKGAPPVVETGGLEINLAARTVTKAGRALSLSRKEFDLLAQLALSVGEAVAHERLLQAVWGSADSDIRYLRVYVGQVREKIEDDPQHPKLLTADAGFGYRLNRL